MKKLLIVVFVSIISANIIAAQSGTGAPNVTVLKKSWRKVLVTPPVYDGGSGGGFQGNDAANANHSAQVDNMVSNNQRIQEGKNAGYLPSNLFPTAGTTPGGTRYNVRFPYYLYSIELKNSGPKTIRKIFCQYIFADAKTGKEVGRREVSGEDIAPGKTKRFKLKTVTAPDNTRNLVQISGDKERTFTESVLIDKIEYADGSVWTSN